MAAQLIQRMFIIPENLTLMKIILLALALNILIFVYLNVSFGIVRDKKGPAGPQGLRGDKGYVGRHKGCGVCNPEPNTFGYEKNEELKRNLIIPKKPLLTELDFDETPNNYFRINNIFNDRVGCPNQLVADENEATTLINTIKNSLNGREPSDDEIKAYLQRIKTNADGNDTSNKIENYPKCYGIQYVKYDDKQTDNSYDTKIVNPYNHSENTILMNANKKTIKCPKGHFLNEIWLAVGGVVDSLYGRCTDGTILNKEGSSHGGRGKKIPIGKQSNLDIFTGHKEYQWARRISGVGSNGNNIIGETGGTKHNLKCKNNDTITGFNLYYDKHGIAHNVLNAVSLKCDPDINYN